MWEYEIPLMLPEIELYDEAYQKVETAATGVAVARIQFESAPRNTYFLHTTIV